MNHSFARVFTLTSIPNALADTSECAARARGSAVLEPSPLEYGAGFGMNVHFKSAAVRHPPPGTVAQGERELADHLVRH